MWQGVLGASNTLILSVPSLAQVWVVVAELQGQLCDMAFDLSGLGMLEAGGAWSGFLSFVCMCVFMCVHACTCKGQRSAFCSFPPCDTKARGQSCVEFLRSHPPCSLRQGFTRNQASLIISMLPCLALHMGLGYVSGLPSKSFTS